MTLLRAASSSFLALLLLGAAARAEPTLLEVPAVAAPRMDGGLADPLWKKGVAFEIRRAGESYAQVRMLRAGRQLYIGYRSEFKPISLGIRFHFIDPETNRTVALLVAPLEMPRSPLSAWLNRRGDSPARLDASSADLRFDFTPEEGFKFAVRLPLDLLEIGRPQKAFVFNIELWDTQARRPLAFYPGGAGGSGGRQESARLVPVGDWGVAVPADTPLPPKNEAVALLQQISDGIVPADDSDAEPVEVIAAFSGHRDGKRMDAPLAKLEARLRKLIDAYPGYASLRANLVRVLIGRNQPAQALEVMASIRKSYPSIARDERQALGELQLLRDSGQYSRAREWLTQHKELLGRLPAYARESTQLDSMIDAWKVEQEYRAEDAKRNDLPRVRLDTDRGAIVLELFEDDAPNTVANFIDLVGRGFYDGTRFHWSVASASLFGGDPNSRDDDPYNDGYGDPGYLIEPERGRRANFPFMIAMVPRRRTEWTIGSNFCIDLAPAPDRDGRVVVFGRVIEGFEAARRLGYYDTLKKATVIRKRNHEYKVVKRPNQSSVLL